MRIIGLSGWGQPHDALAAALPDATHVAYTHHNTVEAALAAIAVAAASHDVAVGWSLGGQLLVRATAAGMIKPKRLVLIGVPFQFVETPKLKLGMKRDTYEKFRNNYAQNPERTLAKSYELIIKGDARADQVRAHLKKPLADGWLNWLDKLDGFSCGDLPLHHLPPTLIIHGMKDAIVYHEQAKHFVQALPQARLALWEDCGHAPHWHDTEKLKRLIREHADV